MAYISVAREHWTRGKRKKTYYAWWREYDISDDLWIKLNQFAEEDEFSDTAKWDWQEDEITLSRSKELDEVFKTYCKAPKDWEVYHEIVRKESGRIKMKPMKFKYEYKVRVLKVDSVNQRAYIKQFPTRKQFEEAVDFTTPEYWVDVSDRCIYEGIKPHDKVMVRKFLDDHYLAVYVSDSYKECTPDELKRQLKDFETLTEDYCEDDDIFGNYTESEREKEERIKKQRKSLNDLMGGY